MRLLGEELRAAKDALGALVTLEAGKITSEGLGEVQEMIDICDFAVGLSRQLYGLTMHSERPGHRMYEQWHPLGVVGVIGAWNFPFILTIGDAIPALLAGNGVVIKPASIAPLAALCASLAALGLWWWPRALKPPCRSCAASSRALQRSGRRFQPVECQD